MKKIVIDPGHGGKDPGAVRGSLREKDFTLQISKEIKAYLQKHFVCEVILTRETDTFVELSKRTKIANSSKADVFVSIHLNAGAPNATGYEVLVHPSSKAAVFLASEISKRLAKTQLTSRGIKTRSDIYVLKHTKMPAALVEVGFITNENDMAYIQANLKTIAALIAEGVASFLNLQKKTQELYRVVLKTGTYASLSQAENAKKIIEEVTKKVAKVYKIEIIKEA